MLQKEFGIKGSIIPMLKHAFLGDASPTEVREAEAVGGPFAVLDECYDVYVACPDDAQYRLDLMRRDEYLELFQTCLDLYNARIACNK